MAAPEATPAAEARIAAATATAAAQEATTAEVVETVADAAIERAQEAVQEAEETADALALAAMQTEIGQRVSALAESVTTWQGAHDQTHATLQSELANLTSQVAGLANSLAQLTAQAPPTVAVVSSTPEPLPDQGTTTVLVTPEATPAGSLEATGAAPVAPARKKIRFA